MAQLGNSVWMHHWNQIGGGDTGAPGRVADRLPPHLDPNQAGQHVPQTSPLGPPLPGEMVLVLGATEPEECIRAADNVGLEGRVIGIEADDERLALCRAQLAPLLQRAGYKNLTFRKARFDD